MDYYAPVLSINKRWFSGTSARESRFIPHIRLTLSSTCTSELFLAWRAYAHLKLFTFSLRTTTDSAAIIWMIQKVQSAKALTAVMEDFNHINFQKVLERLLLAWRPARAHLCEALPRPLASLSRGGIGDERPWGGCRMTGTTCSRAPLRTVTRGWTRDAFRTFEAGPCCRSRQQTQVGGFP